MDVFRIVGGSSLSGTVAADGSKNAALPIMAATILCDAPVALAGVPELSDVDTLALVLGHLGIEAKREASGLIQFNTVDSKPTLAGRDLVGRMRASFCVLGPLLARRGRAVVALPGGCAIGNRPIELHLKGLAALGANLRIESGHVVATAKRLRGATVCMLGPNGPTVTGTANVMMAAALAGGQTTIVGAAREPEVVDLGHFLNSCGARIEGLGESTISIIGVDQLGSSGYQIIPDRIEAATLLIAAAITRGSATVTRVVPNQLSALLEVLDATGAQITLGPDSIRLSMGARPKPFCAAALPYPGIPTDIQAQLTALASLADGKSRIADQVFPERFHHIPELIRMGAAIERRGNQLEIAGRGSLIGAMMTASDLRASSALVLAALAARGTSLIRRIELLDRGYQRLEEKLNSLGSRIQRHSRRHLPLEAQSRRAAATVPSLWKAQP